MRIICIETQEARPQQTFDEASSSFRILIPVHLIGPIKETLSGCEIQLAGGFNSVQSAELYDEVLRKLNEMHKE